ncbi:hypothetical protein ACVR1G_05315 [Streptococcus dentasini]
MASLEEEMTALAKAQEEFQKEQERIMIKALVLTAKAEIQEIGEELKADLETLGTKMKSKIASKVRSSLEAALQGQAADAAKNQVASLPEPHFTNPVSR